jgi:hypothetical protein
LAQRLFKSLDLAAYGAVREVKLFRGLGEAGCASSNFEDAKRVKGRELMWHP